MSTKNHLNYQESKEPFIEKDVSKSIEKVAYDFFKERLNYSKKTARKYAREIKINWTPGHIPDL